MVISLVDGGKVVLVRTTMVRVKLLPIGIILMINVLLLLVLLQVLATNGDTHLGGEDFDQRVMQYFIKMLKKKGGTDITGDNRALQKLRREVTVIPENCPRQASFI